MQLDILYVFWEEVIDLNVTFPHNLILISYLETQIINPSFIIEGNELI